MNWKFNKHIVQQFDEHITKSIPYYEIFHNNILELAKYHIRKNTEVIDIGTSTGTLIKSLYDKYGQKQYSYIGVDIQKCMIKECKKRYKKDNINFIVEDSLNINYKNSSIISIVLVLQFMSLTDRIKLLKKIYNEIDVDSCVFIVEKILTSNVRMNSAYSDLYYDFKRDMGLSDKEILDKNYLLRGIMKPITLEESLEILKDIGFKVDINMKYNNFVSLVAVK